jgi:methionyl-tRNA formyltransferase
MEKLRIVFMGTPEFAAHNLRILHQSGANVVAVVTAPDKPAGRGRKVMAPAVKQMALDLGIPVLQPEKLKDPVFLEQLRNLKPDLQVVVAFRMLPEVVWNLPSHGTFNLHASLLPQYRGAAPINWAVINGETVTGVTTFFLNHEIDTGNIIMQQRVAIEPADNAGSVHDKLMETGAQLVVKTVAAIEAGAVNEQSQSADAVDVLKPAPKIFKEDCRINWTLLSEAIHNKVRGLSPYPAAWTEMQEPGKAPVSLKVYATVLADSDRCLKPGELFCDGKEILLAGTGDRTIGILEIQVAGKKRMPVNAFLRGYRWVEGTKFL